MSDNSQLVRLDAASGNVVWKADLPYYLPVRKDKHRRDIYVHYGPLLAGNRLIVASSDGELRAFDPGLGDADRDHADRWRGDDRSGGRGAHPVSGHRRRQTSGFPLGADRCNRAASRSRSTSCPSPSPSSGRPNVGKSTLFNRLVGRRLALVDDQPGVTRDLREGEARLGDLRFVVIDTAGLEDATDDSLQGRMRRLTERAVDMADICLFLIDGRAGVTAADQVFADILRRQGAQVILGVNKAEGRAAEAGFLDAYALGLGEPLRLSAEHGEGMDDLYRVLQPLADSFAERAAEDAPGGRCRCERRRRGGRPAASDPGETVADRGDRPAERGQVDPDQPASSARTGC